jgi:hypothetical protein
MKLLTFRYSLRWLLLASALLPAVLYWLWLPTLNAQQFAAAVNSGNYAAAERLCVQPGDQFPGSWRRHKTCQPRASVKPATWGEFAAGTRQLVVAVNYGDGHGLASCGLECQATRRGIEIGMAMP